MEETTISCGFSHTALSQTGEMRAKDRSMVDPTWQQNPTTKEIYMKKLLIPAALAASLAIPASALAATTAQQTFNVTVALTAVCSSTTSGTPAVAFGTYTAFGAAINNVAVSPGITFQCTRGLPTPTAAFDTGTAAGVVGGLQYTLSAPSGSKTTTGTAASSSSTGSADVYTYTFNGSIAGGQAGDTTASTTDVRQLIISY
jgi:hypothetical protein